MGHSETWSRLLPENTSIIRVPGNHFTMLRGSNAATIARLLE
jgi:thioesterase domain-containing protein